uniref:ORF355 n=2 Tax=Zea mays TaxID=4577 RepID=O21316_MAIZE|nr:p39.9 [Zea mays]ABE98708.1 orf355-1 [Zea mays subsp. mays]AAN33124.1 unknown [Zea mays]AAN39289.1 ORF355 [Zea mays]AAN40749.1 unknown [Zea mays]
MEDIMSTIRILLPLRKQITGYFDKPSLSLNRDSTNEFLSTFLKTYIEDIHDFHFIDEDPIDRGESSLSLDKKNTTYYEADASDEEMDITDGIEGIIGGTNRGHNGGGDGEALFIQISRLLMEYIKYYILNITHTYDAMLSEIPWWIADSILKLLSLVCIHYILRFNPLIYMGNRFDIIYKVLGSVGAGLKSLIPQSIVAIFMQVSTRHFDERHRKYLYGFFNILVYYGIGLVVRYYITPHLIPDLGFFRLQVLTHLCDENAGASVPAAPPLPQRRAGARFPTILLPPEPNEPPQSGVGRSATTPPEPKTSTACLEVVKALLNGAARGCTGSWCTGIWDELKNCCSPSSCCDEWID